MKIGDKVKLLPLFPFHNQHVGDRFGIISDIHGSFLSVKVEGLAEHIDPFTTRRPWNVELCEVF